MVNYDLPWNPNRIEQRFGRIHRIGQREVCHLWNLVAYETREGEVWHRLLAKLDQIVDSELDTEKLRALIEDRCLVHERLDPARVRDLRDQMERAQARRLQFVEVSRDGRLVNAGFAPYLDYAPTTPEQHTAAVALLLEDWLGDGLEGRASAHAIKTIVPEHLREVKARREALIDKTLMQVKTRLRKREDELTGEPRQGRTTPFHRSQRPGARCRDGDRNQERNPDRLEQARQLHPGVGLCGPAGGREATLPHETLRAGTGLRHGELNYRLQELFQRSAAG